MKMIGFDEVLGDSFFNKSYARTAWGVDDKAFFEQAADRVIELHQASQPFFATLLTVGTHHPYTVPATFRPRGVTDKRVRAYRWLDESVKAFVDRIHKEGVLKDTLVIFTSDESAGMGNDTDRWQRLLSHNWSFAIVLQPSVQPRSVGDLFGHVDLAISVVDALGLSLADSPYIGRSMFRDY